MPDVTTILSLATSNPRGFVVLALYLAVSGLLSLAIAHRSQVDAWAESRPRLAGVLKLLRGFGLDPWVIIQGLSLIFRGKLPEKLKQAQAEGDAKAKRTTIKPPPLALMAFCLAMICLACAMISVACASQPEPCSPQDAVMAAKAAECRARVKAECADVLDSECPVIAECDAWGEARCGGAK